MRLMTLNNTPSPLIPAVCNQHSGVKVSSDTRATVLNDLEFEKVFDRKPLQKYTRYLPQMICKIIDEKFNLTTEKCSSSNFHRLLGSVW